MSKLDVNLLKAIGDDVADSALAALEEGAQLVVDEAKSRVSVKSGKLKNSIHYEKKNKGEKIKVVADAKDEKGFAYGPIVEFSPRIDKPFMYPALDARRAEVRQKIIDAIKEACAKHAKR